MNGKLDDREGKDLMERLNALDAQFLHIEDEATHMHIAGVSIFAGPAPSTDDLLSLLTAKMHLIPRYRQRVRSVPFELGRPIWVDDPHFNLLYHVRQTALPAPGDDEALRRLMGRLMSQPLDRNRPLWETWLVEGLSEGRWALISKVHHCMVDGIAGVDLLGALLDIDPDAELPEAPPWSPKPPPSNVAVVVDAWEGLATDSVELTRSFLRAARDPLGALESVARTGSGLIALGRHLGSTPPLSIEGPIGPYRSWVHTSVSIADVRTIRDVFPGSLNDVVLAAVTNGYRQLLASRGEDVERAVVRTLVPVSVRTRDGRGIPDNRVSAILEELPVSIDDPVVRLEAIHRRMDRLKSSWMAEAGEAMTTLGNLAPPMVLGPASRLLTRLMHQLGQHSVNTVTTNVPGPQFPLYCLGREMLAYLPFVPIAHGIRVGTAILSYNGQLAFGITGDFDTTDDVGVLTDGIDAGIQELLQRARNADGESVRSNAR